MKTRGLRGSVRRKRKALWGADTSETVAGSIRADPWMDGRR